MTENIVTQSYCEVCGVDVDFQTFHIYSFDRLLSFLFREKAKEDRKVFYLLQDEPFYHAYSL